MKNFGRSGLDRKDSWTDLRLKHTDGRPGLTAGRQNPGQKQTELKSDRADPEKGQRDQIKKITDQL